MQTPPQFSAVSLFSGCGGSDIGLKQAGIEVVWANEKNESACDFYENVTGKRVIEHADVASIDKFPSADILVGCYPCQGYSQGGLRDANSRTNFLYREFDRALRQIKPVAFIVENVDGMRFSQNKSLLNNQLTRFRMAGYKVTWKVLNALDYGLAQSRKRLFIVGIRSDLKKRYVFPDPTHGSGLNKPHRTQKDVIWKHRNAPKDSFNDEPFHWYYLSRNRRRTWEQPAGTIVARDRHVGLHPDSPELIKIATDHWEFTGDPSKARRLSYIECALLQGFPSYAKFKRQSIGLRYRAIGNAVPPPLFKAVSSDLVKQLQ